MSTRHKNQLRGRQAPNSSGGTTTEIVAQSEYFEGVLPHPEIMAGYEALSPGTIEWMKDRVARQQEHRMKLEEHAVRERFKQGSHGQVFALVLGLGTLAVAGLGFYWHQPLAGFGAVVVGIGSIGGAYIYGIRQQSREREEKEKTLHSRAR
jgi:uncharacterized membrane protein